MLALITAVWYVCGGLFALYFMICVASIVISEKAVESKSQDLFDSFEEFVCPCLSEISIDENDITTLSEAFGTVNCSNTFDFYRGMELFKKVANEYNSAAQKYNELVTGYPSCMIARVLGKEVVAVLRLE